MSKALNQMVGFHFMVSFFNLPTNKKLDINFKSVSGLNVTVKNDKIKEGGENRFVHTLPSGISYEPIILKRGVLKPKDSGLTQWCQMAFQEFNFVPLETVDVIVLDDRHNPILRWKLSHVIPLKWKISKLNAQKSEILIETLVLKYANFKVV
jgi:phage tail-like protein